MNDVTNTPTNILARHEADVSLPELIVNMSVLAEDSFIMGDSHISAAGRQTAAIGTRQ